MDYYLTKISEQYDFSNFDCGEEQLNKYLKNKFVFRDVRLNLCTCFLAISKSTNQIIGYYTITPTSLQKRDLSLKGDLKRIPYSALPFLLVGRFAVDLKYQQMHIGTALFGSIINQLLAMKRFIAFVGLVVDAKNDALINKFYQHLGFKRIGPTSKRLILLIPFNS